MLYLPHERLAVEWKDDETGFNLTLPWLTMQISVTETDKPWIKEAVETLHKDPLNENAQRFIKELKEYPVFYLKPRKLEDFKDRDPGSTPSPAVDVSTPQHLVNTIGSALAESVKVELTQFSENQALAVDVSTPRRFFDTCGIPAEESLRADIPAQWSWDREKILEKARIEGTDLYDPMSFVTYLICYRLEWESTTWSGQDGLGQILEGFLKEDEDKFFRAIGWITRQSWYVTKESGKCLQAGLEYFPQAQDLIQHFIADEAGHYKFMEQVFDDLGLKKEDFTVGPATKWLLDSHSRMAVISPLAFSAMINLFEAAYYEGEDPISRVVKKSSKPNAARGFDLHYKINQEHRHCDMPVVFAQRLGPQTKEHLHLTLAIFELTLCFLDHMEKRLDELLEKE